MTILKTIIFSAGVASAVDTRRPDRNLLDGNWEAGPCPDMMKAGVENFDKDRWTGNWFEIIRDRSAWFLLGDDCNVARWKCDQPNPLFFGIPDYFGFSYECAGDTNVYVPEEDRISSTDQEGNGILARFPYNSGFGFVKAGIWPESPFIVIDTDYNNYSIEYTCQDLVFMHNQNAILRSRTPRLA